MPWEHIGECGSASAQNERARMIAEVKTGVHYIESVCGPAPEGCKLGVMWHEHDEGEYATVGLQWQFGELANTEWEYISRAEQALTRLDDAVDWSPLEKEDDDEDLDEEEESEEHSEES